MMTKKLVAGLALGLSMLTACGQPKTNSKLDGHYENATASDLNRLAGQQRATAEWEDSQGVIIALPVLTEMGRSDMAAAILNSGVETLWVIVPSTFSGTAQTSSAFAPLRSLVGSAISRVKIVKSQTSGSHTIWARDWSPLSGVVNGGATRLLDFNYYTDRDADDFAAQSMERLLDFDRVSIPVYNEGGNFMSTTDGRCFMTTRVTDANRYREQADDIVLDAEGVKHYYKVGAGCDETTIFPRIPYEGTGHIDMWAKLMDDNTVIVSELRNEVLNLYSGNNRTKTANIQKYLNDRAADFQKLGFNVVRIPTPGPVWSSEGDVFRSYTNSLFVNGHAIVPRYVTPAFQDIATAQGTYLDEAFRSKYEAEARSIYENLGYQFTWVNSDNMIAIGGAVHCTTMQIAL